MLRKLFVGLTLVLIFFSLITLVSCIKKSSWDIPLKITDPLGSWIDERRHALAINADETAINKALAGEMLQNETPVENIEIVHPFQSALFPMDMAAPIFIWKDSTAKVKKWIVAVVTEDKSIPIIATMVNQRSWRPATSVWQEIKRQSKDRKAVFTVMGLKGKNEILVSKGTIEFATSRDDVDAAISFYQAPLPFWVASDNPELFRYRQGQVADQKPPLVVSFNRKVCGNCHFGNDMKSRSFGTFQSVSPDNRFETSVVAAKSLVVLMNDLMASEFFYQMRGNIAYYDRGTADFLTYLPGASDPKFVQTVPAWSADSKYIYFARSPINQEMIKRYSKSSLILSYPHERTADLNQRFPIQYDIYRVPFNDGKGGTPQPVKGASQNGFSNYFPSLSPDGRWLVFNRAESGFLLQPTSRLFIAPAGGGEAREMRCNLPNWNSYHSFSPNSKWIVFTSKELSNYTQLFLTHINEKGESSVPVWLDRFHNQKYAALRPRFVK